MLSLQEAIRVQVNHDLDCSQAATRLSAMQAETVGLIRQRNAIGGIEAGPDVAVRLRPNYRPELRRRLGGGKEKPGRSRVLPL